MSVWERFRFHELTTLPRAERPNGDRPDAGWPDLRQSLAASLTGAHAVLLAEGDETALLTAWVRPEGERRLRVLLGGHPSFPPAAGAPDVLPGAPRPALFPPGALAVDVTTSDAARLLDGFKFWVPCSGRADVLWATTTSAQDRPPRRGSFDQHVAHLPGPFAWVVVAAPVPADEVTRELGRLVNEILPLSRGEVGEAKRIELERKRARHRDLSRAQVGGVWRIRVLVGAMDEDSAAAVAGLLCAAAELDALPYVVAPAGPAVPLEKAVQVRSEDEYGNRVPVTAGTDLLVALTRPPERELPGLRMVEPPMFDVTPEPATGTGLPLGMVLGAADEPVGDLLLNRESLNQHTFVCGATGGGKSHTVRHLLMEASRAGLPWLVIEPAKAEYSLMAAYLAPFGQNVTVIRPGAPDIPPAGFNPLEPARAADGKTFPLQTHADLLRALFLAAFESAEPFPQILSTAITRCYEELGWDLALGRPVRPGARPRYPDLGDLQRVAARVVDEVGYGKEITADVHGFIKVRLSSLRTGTTGRFFEGGHELDFARLRDHNVVMEIEDVGDDADKAFLIGAVLIQMTEHLRNAARPGVRHELSHLTVIEEAHRLLRRTEPGMAGAAAHAVEMFAALLAEVRAYGEGLVIAEQIPSKLIADVIKNTAIKVVHRLPAKDDRESVGATMNLDDEQSRYVVSLVRGEAAVFTDGMDRPLLVRVPPDALPDDAAAHLRTAPVAGLIGRRSVTCGPICRDDACTLLHMRQAQHLLAAQPWLTVWAELTVLAHVTGRTTPELSGGQRRLVTDGAVEPRTLDCAVSHAVDGAVSVRSALLQPDVRPGDLATHCAAVLRAGLTGDPPPCADDAFGYLAEPYRWSPVYRVLAATAMEHGPHPDTDQWERRFGRRIPGTTRQEQRDVVEQWYDAAMRDQVAVDAVTYGAARPSAVERAIGGTAGAQGWEPAVKEALRPFATGDWPLMLLTPHADGQ